MQLAVQYLTNRRLRITDIAEMLGYSSIGALPDGTRALSGCPRVKCARAAVARSRRTEGGRD